MLELVLIFVLVGLVVGMLLTSRRQRWASVHTSWVVPATEDRVSRRVGPMLDAVPRTTLQTAGGQGWTVSVSRAQGWVVVANISRGVKQLAGVPVEVSDA